LHKKMNLHTTFASSFLHKTKTCRILVQVFSCASLVAFHFTTCTLTYAEGARRRAETGKTLSRVIEIFKIIHQKYDASCSPTIQFNNTVDTRGNKYKLLNKSFHYDIRKYSFTACTINTWNSLPNKIVDAKSVNTFKTSLDKYWSDQPLPYYFKAELAGTEDGSKCDNEV